MLAYDIETNGREFTDPAFRIIMLAADDGRSVRVWENGGVATGVSMLEKFPDLVGHNSSAFDRVAINAVHGKNLRCHDTMLMAFLLDEEAGQRGVHGLRLEALAVKYLGVEAWKNEVTWDWHDTDGWEPDDSRWAVMRRYCARDTRYTYRLAEILGVRLRDEGLWDVYRHLLLPASRALATIEGNGFALSAENVATAQAEFETWKSAALKALQEKGLKNPGSTKQLSEFLFTRLGLQPAHFTPKGKPSTDELALKRLKQQGQALEIVDDVLAYRGSGKMLSTYLGPYTEFARKSPDGRIRPSYSLTYTVTGRTSSFSPNIQNVPRDKRVRSIVSAAPGNVLVQIDLSQAELRTVAFVAREESMLTAFRNGDDLHYLMAERITGLPRTEITGEQRTQLGKVPNFSLLYGAETSTFVDYAFREYDLVFSWADGNRIRDVFFEMWPGLIPFYRDVYRELKTNEYVLSATGRRRRFPSFNSYTDYHKTDALKQAINFKVQSLASDIALCMLVLITGMGYKCTAYIHDAVHIELPTHEAEAAGAHIKASVEKTVPSLMRDRFGIELDLPLVADVSIAANWGAMKH